MLRVNREGGMGGDLEGGRTVSKNVIYNIIYLL
jgi:hypothetical protein